MLMICSYLHTFQSHECHYAIPRGEYPNLTGSVDIKVLFPGRGALQLSGRYFSTS